MIKTIDTDVITDEMLYAGVYAAERCSDAGITDLKDVIYDAIFSALEVAPAVEPAQSELLEVVIAMRDWIDAVPHDLQLPTMPGFDRDWADAVIADAQKGKPAQYAAEPVGIVRTVGGYPDDSQHTIEWLVKHKDLRDGDNLYLHPPTVPPAIVEPAQSVPFAYMRVMVGCRAPDDCEEYLDVCNPDDVGIDGKAFPVYKVPPAIDDAPRQKAIARDVIALAQAPAVEPAQSAAEPVASSFAPHMRFITNDELTEFQERNRARLEKSRLIDSPPTVPPAIDDETKRMALDFVRWIASLKIGGFIEARANDLLRLLEAGNGE